MAVAPASMADKIIILDDDDEVENPQPSCVSSNSSSKHQNKDVSALRTQQPALTHITQSPFALTKEKHVLEAENKRLFTEFMEHCSPFTHDCPEVLTFLETKHDKASPEFLSSVEFRNSLGRCLTLAQANRSKTFVYINELCTILRQHAAKKRQSLTKVESSTSSSGSSQSTSVVSRSNDQAKGKADDNKEEKLAVGNEQPSTSGLQEDNNEEQSEAQRKAKRASRKQIAYLENLLKVYNDEIFRLQKAELSLDDMGDEDSLYIQEHRLKRKMMKIYEKLCELKGCSTRTGRVIEQRIHYSSTRYPEINKRIERFINSPEAHMNPPDYPDILQQVLRANERYNLCLNRKQLNQIAKEAFGETGNLIQKRRQMDLVYNSGSHLTDQFKPDPALSDSSLLEKLRSNKELAVSRLEEVITKYATQQEETEETERQKRLEKGSKAKEGNKSGEGAQTKEVNGETGKEEEEDVAEEDKEVEEEEEEEEEEDESSDPDIEEEIQASTQQDGPDDDDDDDDDDEGDGENQEDDSNEAEQAEDALNKEDQTDRLFGRISAIEEGSAKNNEDEPVTSGISHLSDESKSLSPLQSDMSSSRDSPSQSEPMQTDNQRLVSNGNVAESEQPVESSIQDFIALESPTEVTKDPADVPAVLANGVSSHTSPGVTMEKCGTQTSATSPPPSPRHTRSQKRKREQMTPDDSRRKKDVIIHDSSEVDITLDMGVFSCNSPQQTESTRADTPCQELVSSSQSTPPPKKNKVNVATQCDPLEIIVLSDSE